MMKKLFTATEVLYELVIDKDSNDSDAEISSCCDDR